MDERARFEEMMEDLLEATGASRTTLRLDLSGEGAGLDVVSAEALAPGVHSIKEDTSIRNLRNVPTVRFLDEQRRLLVQNDCVKDEPASPPELVDVYGVRAQMLAPLLHEDRLVGVISVHYVPGPRDWSADDISALQETSERIQRDLDGAD